MNLCSISSYLLIYIILWHGKRLNLIVNVASESAHSGYEEQTPKSGTSSRTRSAGIPGTTVHSTHISQSKAHTSNLIDLDVSIKQNTDEYTYSSQNDVQRFIATGNKWFSSASKRGQTFWSAKNKSELGKKVVISKQGGEPRFRVYFDVDAPETGDEGHPPHTPVRRVKETPAARPSTGPVDVDVSEDLIVLDIKKKLSTNEYEYHHDAVNDVHSFIAKPPRLFGIIYKGSVVAWESEDERYPNVALILKDDLGNPFLRVYYPGEKPAPLMAPEEEEEEEEIELKVEEIRPPKRKKDEDEEESEAEAEEEAAPEPTGIVVVDIREQLRERIPVVLNIKSKSSNAQYTFTRDEHIGTYEAHDSFGFNSVVKNTETVWTARDPTQLATKVMLDGVSITTRMNNVTIYMLDGTIKHYQRVDDRWTVRSNRLDLDVNRRSTTLQYIYHEHHDIGTYTARHDYAFRSVVLGPYCCKSLCTDSSKEIWRSDGKKFAKKVVIYLNLCTLAASFVSVHISKNNIQHYEKRGESWVLKQPLIELNIEVKDSCYEYYYSGYDEIRSYCTNYNFVFTRVHQSNAEIWKATGKKYAKMVMMNGDGVALETNKLAIVLVNGRKLYYNKDRGSWAKAEFFPPFELDIDDTFSTDYVECVLDEENKTATYTAKHGFFIRSVVQDGVIWFTDRPDEYGVKVLVVNDKNDVTIIQKNGKKRQFTRADQGQPWSEEKVKAADKKAKEELTRDISRGKLVPVILDLSSRTSTDTYEYARKGSKELYTVIDRNLIKGVRVGIDPKDKIWFPKNLDEYVTKVEVDLTDYPGYLNDVSVYLLDGTSKQFVKIGQNKKWCQVLNV